MRADNTNHLAAATQQRSEQARIRAEGALTQLIAARQPITVAGLARVAGVSRSWLYEPSPTSSNNSSNDPPIRRPTAPPSRAPPTHPCNAA
jgi:hypothetical protein